MTDTPSSILLTREQSTGSNTNTWGGYLIVTQRITEQASKGYQTLAVTGDATITWTNYTTGNTGTCAFLKLTGSLTSAATLTFPSYMNDLTVYNAAGATVTIKCSGGTGVAIPNGRRVRIYCDTTDYSYSASDWSPSATTLTNAGDLPTYTQVQTLIANAGLPASTGAQLVSASDTTAGYTSQKNTAATNGGLVRSTLNPAGNEQNQFALDFTNLAASTNVVSTDLFAVYDATALAMKYQTRANAVGKYGLILQTTQATGFSASAGLIYPVDVSSAAMTITLPASAAVGDAFGFVIGGLFPYTFNPNGLKINGSTANLTLSGEQTLYLTYHSAARGYV